MSEQGSLSRKPVDLLALIGRLRTELKTNRRAAIGLVALGCLAAGYGILGLDDAIAGRRAAYSEAVHHMERVIASGEEKDWPARAETSAAIRKSLEARLWRGESEGMMRANLQDWVTDAARKAGLERTQIQIELVKPTGMPPAFRQLTATINALQTEASLLAFLDLIKREPHLLVVDHLVVRQQPLASLEMKLVAYTVVTGNGPAAK